LKFIITLLSIIIGSYFVADFLLQKYIGNRTSLDPVAQTKVVEKMGNFLEQNSGFEGRLTPPASSFSFTTSASHNTDKNVVQKFQDFYSKKLKVDPGNQDEELVFFNEMSSYIHDHPKASAESLEQILLQLPVEQKDERDFYASAFIQASILYINSMKNDEVDAKKANLYRWIGTIKIPEVKESLEGEFYDLFNNNSPPPMPPVNRDSN
jgi:hypothetical protein